MDLPRINNLRATMTKSSRFWMAALCAPVTLPVVYFLSMYYLSGYRDSNEVHLAKLIKEALVGILPISYLASFVMGIPIVYVLSRMNKLSVLGCAIFASLAGLVVGSGITFIYTGPSGYSSPLFARFTVALMGGCAGLIVALVFGAIAGIPAKRCRPICTTE